MALQNKKFQDKNEKGNETKKIHSKNNEKKEIRIDNKTQSLLKISRKKRMKKCE